MTDCHAWEEAADASRRQRQYYLYNYEFNPWEKQLWVIQS